MFLQHAVDAGVNDDFMQSISIKGLLEKQFSISDATKLMKVVESYMQAHAAADAAADAFERSIRTLEDASTALRHLTINDVLEIRGMTTPSLGVRLLMQCVCIVLRVKPLVKLDALRQPVYDYWEPSKQHLLVDPKMFLERLWAAMGQDIDDSIVNQVEDCLGHSDMAQDRLKRITKSSVSDVAQWLRALCMHHHAKSAASKQSFISATSESASKRLFVPTEKASPNEPPHEDVPFKISVKGQAAVFPAMCCGVLIVLAYGPKAHASSRDIQSATGQPIAAVDSVVAAMLRDNVLQRDKVISGHATFSILAGVIFDAACAARHCRSCGFFKTDLSYALQVKALASLAVSVYEQKPSAKTEQQAGSNRRK